jgi:Phosphate-selective porin O and P
MRAAFFVVLVATSLAAQTTTPSPDTPSIKVGAVLFADYTYTASVAPPVRDADGNEIHPNSFNVSRAYINILGSLNRYISFRITPEVARETGSGSSLSGSQTFRLKFAWAQFNLEQWLTKGSWIRAGINQTPWVDYEESIYRYRFQGTVFVDREGFLFPSDNGITFHYNFPRDFGDVQAGVYNGEGWAHSDPNGEKALQIRAAVRPVPGSSSLHGLRLAGFYDADHYASGLPRNRAIGQVTYEHPRVNAGIEVLSTTDRPSFAVAETKAHGSSIWATPKFGHGWEALLRHDALNSQALSGRKTRDIEGIAYWVPLQAGVSSAVMLDRDATRGPAAGTHTTSYGLKVLISF